MSMAFIQKHRGAALVGDILNVSETQVRRFSRNPKMNYADPSAPNPFDWVIGLMDEIHDLGKEEMLLSALNMMACRYGCFVAKDHLIAPEQTDHWTRTQRRPAKMGGHAAGYFNRRVPWKVRYLMGELVDEIRQNYTLYLEKRGAKKWADNRVFLQTESSFLSSLKQQFRNRTSFSLSAWIF